MPQRLTAGLLAMLMLAAGLLVTAVAPASAGASYFVGKINAERAEAGRKPMSSNGELAAIALAHSKRMAAEGDLYHNPKLASQVRNYQLVAENVGYGPNEATIHAAFMASAGHRANILDKRLTQVGVGVTTDAKGRVWVTEVFRLPTGTTSGTVATAPKPTTKPAAKPSAKPAAKPAPKPSSTPTPKPAKKAAAAPKPVITPKPTPTPTVAPEPRPTAAGILRAEQQSAPTPVSYAPASSPSRGPGAWAVILAFGTALLAGLGLRIPLT